MPAISELRHLMMYYNPLSMAVEIWDGSVSGAVAGSSTIVLADGVTGTIKATVFDYASSNPAAVVLVDASGVPYVAGGATGLTDAQLRASAVNVNVGTMGGTLGERGADYPSGVMGIAGIDYYGTPPEKAYPIPLEALGASVLTSVVNGLGAAAVPIQDGGNSITVDTSGFNDVTSRLSDGNTVVQITNGAVTAAVKAASTLPLATDTALVVTLRDAVPLGATAALQTTGNTALTSIDGKTPALGQQLAAASSPVVLTAAQMVTLTPPAAITGFNLEATQLLVKAKTDNIPAQGQALAAASLPVVLPAIQQAALSAITAVASNYPPANTEQTASALSQTLGGEVRVVESIQPAILDILQQMLLEMRVQTLVLHTTLNCRDELDRLRSDLAPVGTIN